MILGRLFITGWLGILFFGFLISDRHFLKKTNTSVNGKTRDFGSVDLNGPKDGRPSEYECSFFFRSMSCGFVLGWRHYPGEWVYDLNYCSYKLDLHSRSVFFIFLLCQELNEDIEASIPFIVYIHIYIHCMRQFGGLLRFAVWQCPNSFIQ